MQQAKLYEKINDKVRCLLCERRCTISNNSFGFCRTRKNVNGTLYTLTYGNISSLSANPIEKKPFFHFWPGSKALTAGTWSCNFTCPWCQNWEISKVYPNEKPEFYLDPMKFIELAKRYNCQGTSFSFNERTLMFEYAIDVFKLALKENLYNTYVSNGYMTKEALQMLAENGLHAINFDVKGDAEVVRKYCNADIKHVWRNVKLAYELNLHVEVTNLIIPSINDDERIINEIIEKLLKISDEIPLHFTRFFPAYKMLDLSPTPIGILEKAYRMAKEAGVKYVYIGNIPGHEYENTYCPSCNYLLIRRYCFDILEYRIKDRKCPKCGEKILIVGKYISR